MPHFIVECTQEAIPSDIQEEVITAVHNVALNSGLFKEADIKVRVRTTDNGLVGGKLQPFIHVFCHIMQGRTVEQRKALTQALVRELTDLFPSIGAIAANVYEFEKATYTNRKML